MEPPILTLTRDDFLDRLFDTNPRWTARSVRSLFHTSRGLDAVFLAVALHAVTRGHTIDAENRVGVGAIAPQVPLMLGRALHLNATDLVLKEMREVGVAAALILSIVARQVAGDPAAVASALAAVVPAVLRCVTKLRKGLGELCVIEVLQELTDRSTHAGLTPEEVVHALSGERCRYPGAHCRYEVLGRCALEPPNAVAIIRGLAKKRVLERSSHDRPPQWQLTL